MAGKTVLQKGQETINPSNTSDNQFAAIELSNARYVTLAVDTLTISTSTNWAITCEYSFDKTNWYKVKLPSNPATSWSKTYTGNATAEFIYVMDSTVMIPIPGSYARFVATLGTFGGTPTMTVRQGMMEI